MGEVITYISDERRCFCQLKLDSGERILISIAGSPGPSIKIVKLAFGGLIPTKTIWETDNPGREIVRLYPEQVQQVRSETSILNLLRDDLIRRKSIAEVQQRLSIL